MIDAALDRSAWVLRDDAGHRAPMQFAADRVQKLHGRELGIIEANQAALAPDSKHPGEVRIGAIGSEPVESSREFGEADSLSDDQPEKTDRIWSHQDLHVAPCDVRERRADIGLGDLGIDERSKEALDAFLHDRGKQATMIALNLLNTKCK